MKLVLPFLCTLLAASASAPPADRWDDPHAGNPVIPGYYADPSLLQYGGKFFVYATIDPWGGRTLGCWESSDFINWTFRELNWPSKEACTSPSSMGSMVWAPSVVRTPAGQFFMYVSVGSEVWVGTAESPLGPWHDAHGGTPLVSAAWDRTYHMIDAEGFVDDDGVGYLYWGSGWDWKNGHCFVARLKPDMTTFDGQVHDVTPPNYFEAPFMFKNAGRYLLMYSHGITIQDTYAVHYAIGNSPFGPFSEGKNSPVLSTDRLRNVVSPGHHAMFRLGGKTYILYGRQGIPFLPGQAFRQLCVDEVTFEADGSMAKVTPTHTGPGILVGRQRTALLAVATASSQLDPLHGAGRVTDDNYATRWAPAADAHGGWLQLDLGGVRQTLRQELRFEYAWKIYRFALEISSDGSHWATLVDRRLPGISGSPVSVPGGAPFRYARLTFPESVGADSMSVWEWTVY